MKRLNGCSLCSTHEACFLLTAALLVLLVAGCATQTPAQSVPSQQPLASPSPQARCGNGIAEAGESSETCCKDVPCRQGFECVEESSGGVASPVCKVPEHDAGQPATAPNASLLPSVGAPTGQSGKNTVSEPLQVHESRKSELAVPEPVHAGPWLNDFIYEYSTRRYYYDDKAFGVADDPTYEGPALRMMGGDSFTMRVFNIILTPRRQADIEINYDSDDYEATGLMGEGDTYVTRDGIKIIINNLSDNRLNFTLMKVPESEHTELCPECIKRTDLREDDGVRFINVNQRYTFRSEGREYKFAISGLDRQTQDVFLQVNGEELPLLRPMQSYVLQDGHAIKFIFAAAHEWGGYEGYGYAGFGFVNTSDLPDRVICPECTDFIYLVDEKPQKFRYMNVDHLLETRRAGDRAYLWLDGKDLVELKVNRTVQINDWLSAKLLFTQPQNRIGLIAEGGHETKTACEPTKDMNPFKKGRIYVSTGSSLNKFEREDVCLNEHTLIEYFCRPVEGRPHKSSGDGWTGALTYASCPCKDGACAGEPVCVGADCV